MLASSAWTSSGGSIRSPSRARATRTWSQRPIARRAVRQAGTGKGLSRRWHHRRRACADHRHDWLHWVIDPIDGTANFVKGIPAWCVVIACAKDGVTVTGVIHEPSTGETFYGAKGGGACPERQAYQGGGLEESRRRVGRCRLREPTEELEGTGADRRSDRPGRRILPQRVRRADAGLCRKRPFDRLRRAAHEFWDCIAGLLLIEEAGGEFSRPTPRRC